MSQQWAHFPNYCRYDFNTVVKSYAFQDIIVLLHMGVWNIMGMEEKTQFFFYFPPILIQLKYVEISDLNLLIQWHVLQILPSKMLQQTKWLAKYLSNSRSQNHYLGGQYKH